MHFSLVPKALAVMCLSVTAFAFAAESHDHEHHHHAAPHGGTLIALGDEAAHLELVLDSDSGKLTGYVLNGEAETAIRINQPQIPLQIAGRDVPTTVAVALKAVANPLTGEASGDTSQFEASSPELKGKKKFSVTIEDLTIKGANFKNTTSKFPEGNH